MVAKIYVSVCLAWLADSLLKSVGSKAAVVDTTGNFDVLRLYSFIVARLQDDAELQRSLKVTEGVEDMHVGDFAARVLDRVHIMRAFDLVGVMEAVGEVRDELEGRKAVVNIPEEKSREEENKTKETKKKQLKKTVIADSEDEDDEEMLSDNEVPCVPGTGAQPLDEEDEILLVDGSSDGPAPPVGDSNLKTDSADAKPTFILIDNLAHVTYPLLKKDHVQAQALTASFLLTLSHLTHNHNLHTLLLNTCTPPKPLASKLHRSHTNPNQPYQQKPPPPPSIFASNETVPALGGLLGMYLDVGLLVGRVPRRKADARAVYRDRNVVKTARRGVETVGVVEVLSDRSDTRGGGWGTFVSGERRLLDVS
ncbi:hypothetical protein N0V90_000371 [Kalmusia sp. IMI 367209]|nr:hypothetical protein N0V90_000371 [Kalmusia sp. IMI 367209]